MVLCVADKAQLPDDYNLQTFRLDDRVRFKDFRYIVHGFWMLKDDIENYNLYLVEDINVTLIEESENKQKIDSFLKNRARLDKGQFIFIKKNHKFGKINKSF